MQFSDIYRGRRVLVTGHTGFKGSWLVTWLLELGAEVTGLALAPDGTPSHWELLSSPAQDLRGDIRDLATVQTAFELGQPEIVFHLAAQALVRRSYHDPLDNWSTNVMGTANVLELCRSTPSVCAVVIVTTDKVYENNEWTWGYRENDRLGGHDPYSASKAACEVLIESYRKSFFNTELAPLIATARAGNVIGGGDWSEDRLIPDLIRALQTHSDLEIRSPYSTRPWQHVLDCLSGYLLLGQHLLEGKKEFSEAWNFGPAPEDNRTVSEILAAMQHFWPDLRWKVEGEPQLHEANLLYLDCANARSRLRWVPALNLDEGIAMTANWYRTHHITGKINTIEQLTQYFKTAQTAGCSWIS